ncbi:MAG: hypothetical protein JNM57_09585 [Cyclobacteriaceae bacterium]|nr:hypothetical protein [Cyclobacteriaceae bacterium]
MKKQFMLMAALVAMLWSCDTQEKKYLQAKVDSLQVEVQNHDQLLLTMQQINSLIDSIDMNRNLIRSNMLEGTSTASYTQRLEEINVHIKATASKITELESKIKSQANGFALTIKKLKNDLELSTQQLAVLTEEAEQLKNANKLLSRNVVQRDSIVAEQQTVIKIKEENIASLDNRILQINEEARAKQADLVFAQAEALELAAARTKLAPRKKKDTQREALELYKVSLSLGKQDAAERVVSLEEKI